MLKDWARAAGFAAVLAAALSGSLFFALYQPPPSALPSSHQQEAHTNQAQQSAASEPRGTKEMPFVVEILPAAPGSPEAAKEEQERYQKSAVDRGLLYFTAVLAVAIIALVIVTLGLVSFAKQQSDETKILQRAYLSADPHGLNPFREGQAILCHVGFYNAGKLPARNVQWAIRVLPDVSDSLPVTSFPIEGLELAGNNVIPPGGTMKQGQWHWLDDRDIQGIIRGTLALYVWGVVYYDDGIGKGRKHTRFCHRYYRRGRHDEETTGRSLETEYMRYHEYGNDAD